MAMGWLSPPDRREITLLLFCTTVYILAYNLETSLQLLGVDSVATSGALFSRIGLGKTRAIDRDGRKPNGWRDKLENEIYGDWKWDEGHVAGNGDERTQRVGAGRHGAAWASRAEIGEVAGKLFGEVPVDEALQWWRNDAPQTTVLKHAAGYTVLDNVFIYDGGVYLVTDHTKDFPPMPAIVSSTGPGFGKWTLLSRRQAATQFGQFGGVIRGVSWMAADPTPHNSTLLALWRTYSSLDPSIDSLGRTRLAPPHRLILPHHRFFTDEDPPLDQDTVRRRRVDTGFHPYLAKAAFPHLTVMYFQDFEDYAQMKVPFMFERLVVADREAASRVADDVDPEFLTAFEVRNSSEVSVNWWEPIRRNMLRFLDLDDGEKSRVVTYIVTQGVEGRAKLKEEVHEKLVSTLKKMERNVGCEVHIIYEDTKRTPWIERIGAIARSSVVLGVHGNHLMDFAFMKRSQHTTFIEMYPERKFVRDRAVIADSLGQQYVAWSGSQKYAAGSLPQVLLPQDHEEVIIDVNAVVKHVQQIISRV